MRALPILCTVALLAGAPCGSAQEPRPRASSLAASIDVSVVDVTVVVRDKRGKPVEGLGQENFALFVDGVRQEITNFSERSEVDKRTAVEPAKSDSTEVSDAKATAPAKPAVEAAVSHDDRNRIVFFLDNLHLHPSRRNWILKHLDRFIDEVFADGDSEGMVIAFDRRLDTVQRFTSKPSTLHRAIEKASKASGGALLRTRDRERTRETLSSLFGRDANRQDNISGLDSDSQYRRALGTARTLIGNEEDDLVRSIKALMSVVDLLSGVEGRKVIVYVTEGITVTPGSEIYAFLDRAFPSAHAQMDAFNYDKTDLFKELTRRANAHGVTLYPVSAEGLGSAGSAQQGKSLDPRYRGAGTNQMADIGLRDAAELMADDTGGLALINTNQIRAGLGKIRDDLESFYSLGFATPGGFDEGHRLSVELVGVDGGLNARVRRGFQSFSDEVLLERAVVSRLSLPRTENALEIELKAHATRTPEGVAVVRLVAAIPWKNLTMLSDGGTDHLGEIEAYVAVMDGAGKQSPVIHLLQQIVLPTKYYEAAQKESYSYTIELPLTSDRWTISVAIRDLVSKRTSYLRVSRLIGLSR